MEPSNEALARKLSDIWFEMYRACAFQSPELAPDLDHLIQTEPSNYAPDPATVRGYLSAVVRGALTTRPTVPSQRSRWRLFR
jgi:hypothetical protein